MQLPQPLDLSVWLGADPALALVTADLPAWLVAHPCDCEALCECASAGSADERATL